MHRTRKILAAVILAPIWVPLGLFAAVVIAAMSVPVFVQGLQLQRRWKRKLRDSGRLMSAEQVSLLADEGTLIIDRPAMGWNTTYCWWTPIDVSNATPIPVPTDEDRKQLLADSEETVVHPFDHWCYEALLSAETGTAMLIATRRGEHVAKRLHNDHPSTRVVYTWSAFSLEREFNPDAAQVT